MLAFPLGVFPEAIKNFIQSLHEVLHFPIDFFATPILSVASASIGNSRRIQVTPDWIEKPILFTCTVGDPGSGKSPAIKKIVSPLLQMQKNNKDTYDKLFLVYQAELYDFESSKKTNTLRIRPTKPIFKQLYTNDATIESLRPAFVENPRGILFYSEELSGWIKSMNQFKGGKGNDRQRWLTFWDGEPWVINRSTGVDQVNDPFIPICGTIQPEIITTLNSESLTEDGLLHRILFSYPEKSTYSRPSGEVTPSFYLDYQKIIESLYQNQTPVILPLSSSARDVFFDWAEYNDNETLASDFPKELIGPWSKMRGQCARLILILFSLFNPHPQSLPNEIHEGFVDYAITLAEYFKQQARKTYGLLNPSTLLSAAREIVERAHKRHLTQLNSDTILSMKIKSISGTSMLRDLFNLLEDQGHGHVYQGKCGGLKFEFKKN